MNLSSPSTKKIIDNLSQFREAVDPDALISEEEFNEMSDEDKVKILVDCGCEIDDTVPCPSCGQAPEWRECDTCGTQAWIVDCGHKAQPRPICGDDIESGKSICDACYEARAERKQAAAILGRKGGSAKSEAKAASSRENGKLGGRPRSK